jgi:hypothetical protein
MTMTGSLDSFHGSVCRFQSTTEGKWRQKVGYEKHGTKGSFLPLPLQQKQYDKEHVQQKDRASAMPKVSLL